MGTSGGKQPFVAARLRGSGGVTVLDLAIGLMVIGIAVVVVFGTLVMPRLRGNDFAAQLQAKRALQVQRTVLADGAGYGTAAELEQAEPTLDYTDDAVVSGKVYVRVEGDTVTLASRTAGGTCYWIRDVNGVDSYAEGPCDQPVETLDFGSGWDAS